MRPPLVAVLTLVALISPAWVSSSSGHDTQPRVEGLLDAGHLSPVTAASPMDSPRVRSPRPSPEQTCVASFYGDELAGAVTASGVPFDPTRLTAAMWDVPFGTQVTVVDPATGRTVDVEITDRGPAHRLGRCIDLSEAAMAVLGGTDVGLVDVVLHVPSSDEEHHHGHGHHANTYR